MRLTAPQTAAGDADAILSLAAPLRRAADTPVNALHPSTAPSDSNNLPVRTGKQIPNRKMDHK